MSDIDLTGVLTLIGVGVVLTLIGLVLWGWSPLTLIGVGGVLTLIGVGGVLTLIGVVLWGVKSLQV